MRDMYKYIIVFTVLFLMSCNKPRITITKSYVYNSEWKRGGYSGLKIYKMLLLDSAISIYQKDFNVTNLRRHIIDSSYCYFERSVDSYHGKIFFDREDKSSVWSTCKDTSKIKRLPHGLSLNEWYFLQYVNGSWEYYVYIDSLGDAHVYGFNPVNW